MLRFHLDEQVPHAIAHRLRRRQIDVTTTTDAALLGANDEDHIAFALREIASSSPTITISFVSLLPECSTPESCTAHPPKAASAK